MDQSNVKLQAFQALRVGGEEMDDGIVVRLAFMGMNKYGPIGP